MNRTLKRIVLPVGAAAFIGSAGFAFMASNSVAASYVGEGTSAIAGYEVSNISYQTSGSKLTWVNFYADPDGAHESASDPANAEISFDGTNWFSCERDALNRANDPEAHFRCDVRGKSIPATVENMRVVVSH